MLRMCLWSRKIVNNNNNKKTIWTKTLNIFLYHVYATYESALAKSFAYIQLKPINKDNRKRIDGYLLHFVLLKITTNVLGNSF